MNKTSDTPQLDGVRGEADTRPIVWLQNFQGRQKILVVKEKSITKNLVSTKERGGGGILNCPGCSKYTPYAADVYNHVKLIEINLNIIKFGEL